MSPRLLAALVATLTLVPAAALACSCAPPPPPRDALAGADAVFEARILSGPEGGAAAADGTPYFGPVTYQVEVLRSWKGSPEPRSAIVTSSQGSMCGRSYEVGANYLVYAYRDKQGNLGDSICTRTRSSKTATEDFAALGDGTKLPAAPGSRVDPAPADAAPEGAAPEPAAAPSPVEEPAAQEPAAEEPDDADTDPSCSMAAGHSGLGLALALPFLARRRRR